MELILIKYGFVLAIQLLKCIQKKKEDVKAGTNTSIDLEIHLGKKTVKLKFSITNN